MTSSDVTLMTYLSSRFDEDPEVALGADAAAAEGFKMGKKAFTEFSMNLSDVMNRFMGAAYGLSAASAAALAITVSTLAF